MRAGPSDEDDVPRVWRCLATEERKEGGLATTNEGLTRRAYHQLDHLDHSLLF